MRIVLTRIYVSVWVGRGLQVISQTKPDNQQATSSNDSPTRVGICAMSEHLTHAQQRQRQTSSERIDCSKHGVKYSNVSYTSTQLVEETEALNAAWLAAKPSETSRGHVPCRRPTRPPPPPSSPRRQPGRRSRWQPQSGQRRRTPRGWQGTPWPRKRRVSAVLERQTVFQCSSVMIYQSIACYTLSIFSVI